jgi:hypothetical protein
MRKWLALAATITVVLAIPIAVLATTGHGSTPVNCAASQFRTDPVSTASPDWQAVPGLQTTITQVRPVIINASALISGAPVEFRVATVNEGAQHLISAPGPTRFVPADSHADSFAYQWIDRGNAASPHSLAIRLQWRSPSGHPVHMLRADMAEFYATDGCPGAGA